MLTKICPWRSSGRVQYLTPQSPPMLGEDPVLMAFSQIRYLERRRDSSPVRKLMTLMSNMLSTQQDIGTMECLEPFTAASLFCIICGDTSAFPRPIPASSSKMSPVSSGLLPHLLRPYRHSPGQRIFRKGQENSLCTEVLPPPSAPEASPQPNLRDHTGQHHKAPTFHSTVQFGMLGDEAMAWVLTSTAASNMQPITWPGRAAVGIKGPAP
ncbi:hypothetical protein TREES_T100001568 [Tupaia chinensis]|uniref:Uncharacterized protein n=1 Tax=Tupaia chinensis TaxID=246437 RepID=L9KKL4_TUPCH|nr:hypothetical protein TREES_T100001568 [Tupaia chinensis]